MPLRKSSHRLFCLIQQCLLYIVFISMTSIFAILNNNLILNDEGFAPLSDHIDLTDSGLSPARFNFYIFSAIIIPLGWGFSYAFLYLYFRCDNYFSISELSFQYENPTDDDYVFGIRGQWQDSAGIEVDSQHEDEIDESIIKSFYYHRNFNKDEEFGIIDMLVYIIFNLKTVFAGLIVICTTFFIPLLVSNFL